MPLAVIQVCSLILLYLPIMTEFTHRIDLPTRWGKFRVSGICEDRATHLILSYGNIDLTKPVLIRIHSSCCFGDVFGGLSCDCGAQLEQSIRAIALEKSGLIFYLNQEGRGLGLAAKLEAINLEQEKNIDTVEAFSKLHFPMDRRSYKVVSDVLHAMSIRRVRLLTNNPSKCNALVQNGIEVIRIPLITEVTPDSAGYINAKIEKMGHLWSHTSESQALVELRKLGGSGGM